MIGLATDCTSMLYGIHAILISQTLKQNLNFKIHMTLKFKHYRIALYGESRPNMTVK